jgi:hypothetical protein
MSVFEQEGFSNPISFLRRERGDAGTVAFLRSVGWQYRDAPATDTLGKIALLVEPEDRILGKDMKSPAAHAFFTGALLGLHILVHCTPPELQERVSTVEYPGSSEIGVKDGDLQQALYERATLIMDTGERGLSEFPEIASFFEDWEPDITPDITLQRFASRGLGLILHIIHEASATESKMTSDSDFQTEVTEVLDAGGQYDWDDAFQKIQGQE